MYFFFLSTDKYGIDQAKGTILKFLKQYGSTCGKPSWLLGVRCVVKHFDRAFFSDWLTSVFFRSCALHLLFSKNLEIFLTDGTVLLITYLWYFFWLCNFFARECLYRRLWQEIFVGFSLIGDKRMSYFHHLKYTNTSINSLEFTDQCIKADQH